MIDVDFVIAIHDEILAQEKGLKGYTNHQALASSLERIDNQMLYDPLDNIFEIASFYAVAIAKAHTFADGNKRTAMVVMLSYLAIQGVDIQADNGLDDVMVAVASGEIGREQLAQILMENIQEWANC